MNFIIFVVFTLCATKLASAGGQCNKVFFDSAGVRVDSAVADGGFVCQCDADSCDSVAPIGDIDDDDAVVYTSDSQEHRLRRSTLKWRSLIDDDKSIVDVQIKLQPSVEYQTIYGFGACFTDTAGIVTQSLPSAVQEKLLRAYYGDDGIRYTIGRVPMASTDLSTRPYSYDDVKNDFNLTHFKLAEEDMQYKIPIIQRAVALAGDRGFRLFASPWSAPAWMKTSGQMKGAGVLKGRVGGQYYETWANYFVKFLDAYSAHNVTFWAVTTQNEPQSGFIPNYGWQTMGYTANMMKDFIKLNLGPTMYTAGYANTKVMIVDDDRDIMNHWANVIFNDPIAASYVDGIGVHWYLNWLLPPSILETTHHEHPDKFILATEGCNGAKTGVYLQPTRGPLLGSWIRGESYAYDIIQDLNHYVTGWTDWSFALDEEGGPSWVSNFVDAPIIVNATAGAFYKQPMYYTMGHFSAFIPPNSRRIDATVIKDWKTDVQVFAATTPAQQSVVVVLNR